MSPIGKEDEGRKFYTNIFNLKDIEKPALISKSKLLFPGIERFSFEDPFGNRIEFLEGIN